MSRCRRINTSGRGLTQAVAASLDPSSSWRCSFGWASLKGRADTSDRDAKKVRKSVNSWSESATGGPGTRLPSARSSHTPSNPTMEMFSILSSSIKGCRRPMRNKALKIACANSSCWTGVHDGRPAVTASAAAASNSSTMIERPKAS